MPYKFKLDPPTCSECGASADGILERVLGWAVIDPDGGSFEYGGHTEIDWNTQEPLSDPEQSPPVVRVRCGNDHRWEATLEEE
jgi:hypothetical protein